MSSGRSSGVNFRIKSLSVSSIFPTILFYFIEKVTPASSWQSRWHLAADVMARCHHDSRQDGGVTFCLYFILKFFGRKKPRAPSKLSTNQWQKPPR
jgi:hypothetical protein